MSSAFRLINVVSVTLVFFCLAYERCAWNTGSKWILRFKSVLELTYKNVCNSKLILGLYYRPHLNWRGEARKGTGREREVWDGLGKDSEEERERASWEGREGRKGGEVERKEIWPTHNSDFAPPPPRPRVRGVIRTLKFFDSASAKLWYTRRIKYRHRLVTVFPTENAGSQCLR